MRKSAIATALGRTNDTAALPRHAAEILGPAGVQPRSGVRPTTHGAPGLQPASRIDADLPAGVYSDSFSQAVQPFAGAHQLPTGQTINVSMNAPNPNLSFKEWAARGVVGGVGHVLAFPFKLLGGVLETAAQGLVEVVLTFFKWVLILILLPTLLYVGMKLAEDVKDAPTVEDGVERVMHHGRHAVEGARKGATDELQPERGAARRTDGDGR